MLKSSGQQKKKKGGKLLSRISRFISPAPCQTLMCVFSEDIASWSSDWGRSWQAWGKAQHLRRSPLLEASQKALSPRQKPRCQSWWWKWGVVKQGAVKQG